MNIDDIKIGQIFKFDHKITKKSVSVFAKLTGDKNKMHMDIEFGKNSKFKKNIVHGMLAGSLFSKLIGMYCPKEHGIYLSQTLNFKLPIFPEDKVRVLGKIIEKSESTKILTIKTEIIKNGRVVIDGVAKAKFL